MAMDVNYIRGNEESRHDGTSLWLPQRSKTSEKVVLSL